MHSPLTLQSALMDPHRSLSGGGSPLLPSWGGKAPYLKGEASGGSRQGPQSAAVKVKPVGFSQQGAPEVQQRKESRPHQRLVGFKVSIQSKETRPTQPLALACSLPAFVPGRPQARVLDVSQLPPQGTEAQWHRQWGTQGGGHGGEDAEEGSHPTL